MKVIHILNTGGYSGAENVAIQIIDSLNRLPDIEAIYMSREGSIHEILKRHDIGFYSVEKVSIGSIRKMVRELKPDILHCHDYTTSILAAFATRKKIVSHLHNNSPWLKRHGLYSWACLIASVRFSSILAVSDSIKKEYVFSRYIARKMRTVGNPINTDAIVSGSMEFPVDEEYDVCFLGRLSAQKSPFLFLEIMGCLRERFPTLKACMIGDGELRNEVKRAIQEKGLGETVDLLGFQSNPYPYLKHSRFLLATSSWEGYGLFAVEALTLGKPVVCTAVGGLPDIVDESCGVVCRTREELLNACVRMLAEESFYQEKARGTKRRVAELAKTDEYMESILKAYED